MLVLSCTSHQSVIIDDIIKVTVLYNNRGQVVLGIDAPDGADIRREDILLKKRETGNAQNINT